MLINQSADEKPELTVFEKRGNSVMRLQIKVSLRNQQGDFFAVGNIIQGIGVISSKINDITSDITEDHKNFIWSIISGFSQSLACSSPNIINAFTNLVDNGITNSLDLVYSSRFDTAATFGLELKIFEQVLHYENFNFSKHMVLNLLSDCKDILSHVNVNKPDVDLNKYMNTIKCKFPKILTSIPSDKASDKKALIFSKSNSNSDEPVRKNACNKLMSSCNIL